MATETRILTVEVEAAANVLAERILESTPFVEARLAKERLDSDSAALALLGMLKQSQAALRRKQARNEVTQVDIGQWRQAQRHVMTNGSIAAYTKAQQEAVAFVRGLNQELSELVGIDLASLLPSGCC